MAKTAFQKKTHRTKSCPSDGQSSSYNHLQQNSLHPEGTVHSVDSLNHNKLGLLQVLALRSLELSAPASDVVLRNRAQDWVQLSGHEGSFAPASPGTIWKKTLDVTEVNVYRNLTSDPMKEMLPKFYAVVTYKGDHFIELEDLLSKFRNASIMDIKMGTRTFLECEVNNGALRRDLYEKMVSVDKGAPSEEEAERMTITKLRYMMFREELSSSSNLGFRIEGYKIEGEPKVSADLKLLKKRDDVKRRMWKFLPKSRQLGRELIERLRVLAEKFMESEYFASHEIIGSSLLIIHDANKVGVWMIDFAKTVPVPSGIQLDHLSNWTPGNHEDGYLIGLHNLRKIVQEIYDQL